MDTTFDFSQIKDCKVLVQLSGGKDSIACIEKLCENGISCEAIHFVHEYSYELPTREAQRICKLKNVPLHILNINDEIKKLFLNNFRERPCRYCKGIMDTITVNFAINNKFDLICVGDTQDDAMLVNRLVASGESNLYLAKYFNKAVHLPENLFIFRPLIKMNSKEVFAYLANRGINVQRVGDTGDKYFEYSREGCPLQFKDFGEPYSESLMMQLKEYNTICSDFARQKNIRASIHLPSEFIVTIPRGYETCCHDYLISNGCKLRNNYAMSTKQQKRFYIHSQISSGLMDLSLLDLAFQRLLEREGLLRGFRTTLNKTSISYVFEQGEMNVLLDEDNLCFTAELIAKTKELNEEHIKNVVIEIFHSDSAIVNMIKEGLNILVFNNNFLGSYGSNQIFFQELCSAIDMEGHHVFCASSFEEAESIVKAHAIDFSISFGQYKHQKDGKCFYDMYSIPHYQWISDNPKKMNIDEESPFIHYIFIDDEFPLHIQKLYNRPLYLPLGCIPKINSLLDHTNYKEDAVLFPAQIRDIKPIENDIQNSQFRNLITQFLSEFDYDSSYILQLNQFIQKHFRDKMDCPKEFFSLTNSYLRIKKRIMVVSSIKNKRIFIAGRRPDICFPEDTKIEFLGEVPYEKIEALMSKYKYVLNVDPNYHSCYHDRLVRSLNAGSVCITNENNKISKATGYSASYRFSELGSLGDLIRTIDEHYDKVLIEQQRFAKGLDWKCSVQQIVQNWQGNQ